MHCGNVLLKESCNEFVGKSKRHSFVWPFSHLFIPAVLRPGQTSELPGEPLKIYTTLRSHLWGVFFNWSGVGPKPGYFLKLPEDSDVQPGSGTTGLFNKHLLRKLQVRPELSDS